MDRFYSFLALEVLTDHFDGYARGKNNYWIYHDPTSDKMVFLPHGMDQMFTHPESSLFPEFKGMLARVLLSTPEGRQRYRERCATLFTNLFLVHPGGTARAASGVDTDSLRSARRPTLGAGAPLTSPGSENPSLNGGEGDYMSSRVADLQRKLRPELITLGTNAVSEHDRAVTNLQQRIRKRVEHLRRHLLVPTPTLTALAPGTETTLMHWLPSVEGGSASLTVTNLAGGTNLLRILMEAPDKPAFASWESRVRLSPGRYQIVAPVVSEQPIFRGPRSPMSLKVWGGEDVQFESTRPDPRHLELARTINIVAEEEILIQCMTLSSGDPLALMLGPVLLRRLE